MSAMRQHADLVSHVAAELKSSRRRTLGADLLAGLKIVFVEAIPDVRPVVRVVIHIYRNPGYTCSGSLKSKVEPSGETRITDVKSALGCR